MIKTLSYTVTGQRIETTETAMLVAGTVNIYTARFAFGAEWDGLQRTAVFAVDGITREQLLEDDACTVPWEVLVAGNRLRVGVYGTKADGTRLPTIWTERRLYINPGAGPTQEAADPSPTLVEQLLARMGDLAALKTDDKSSLVAAINEVWSSGGSGGASVTDAAINEYGHLIITLSTGKKIDAGRAVGAAGAGGKSAYQYAVDGGYTGTEAEFAAKLAAEIPAVDDTLKEAGKAADAAAVGDALSSLSEEKVSQAELGENNVVSFKNAEGVVLFTLDLSGLGVATYGNLVLSVETLTVEEGGTGTFTVALDSAPSAIQTVYLAVSDNTRLSVSPETLTFTPENYAEPQTVTVSSVQDDDNVDDSITVALTSKNVDGKQLVVTVSDNYYVPELVMNGLVLHFDYTNKVDDTSDTIADLVYGVTATGFSSMSKTVNGIYGNGTEVWLTPDKTSEAYNAFKLAFAASAQKGFTVEAFGNFYARMFYFKKGYGASTYTSLIHTQSYPISSGNVGSSPPASGVPYLNSSGESVTLNKSASKNFGAVENYDKYFHLAIVFNPDGTIKFYANGVDITNASDTAPDGFTAWDIDTIADNLYLLCSAGNRFPTSDAYFLAEQRMYNRPLTQDEIIQNMEYTASKLGLLTF